MEVFASTVSYLLIFTSILTIVALGGLFSEKSGVIALSLEGSMTIGALIGAIFMKILSDSGYVNFGTCLLVMFMAILGGLLYSMLLAVAAVKFKADQTLVGTALNILSTALAVVLAKLVTASPDLPFGQSRIHYLAFYDAFSFTFPGMPTVKFNWLVIILYIAIPIIWFFLYKTRFGLRLRSCGENPAAADSLGVKVSLVRFEGVGLSGILAGIGGLTLILTGAEWDFSIGANGFGFLALAVLIFGQWKPLFILLGALLFGLFKTISVVYQNIDFLKNLNISSYFYLALPYIVCLITLIFTSKKNSGPKASGIPYDKSRR